MAAASAEPAVAATASAAPTAPTKALANPQSIPNKPPAPPTTSNVSATKNGKLNVDSSSRQNHVANARKNYGSSTPSFKSKCQALLSKLSSCENIQNEYLLATESRQEVLPNLCIVVFAVVDISFIVFAERKVFGGSFHLGSGAKNRNCDSSSEACSTSCREPPLWRHGPAARND